MSLVNPGAEIRVREVFGMLLQPAWQSGSAPSVRSRVPRAQQARASVLHGATLAMLSASLSISPLAVGGGT